MRLITIVLALAGCLLQMALPAHAQTNSAADVLVACHVRGGCQLTGIGLVVGLAGKGDDFTACPQTAMALKSRLLRLGVARFNSIPFNRNVAMVSVTAEIGGPSSNRTDYVNRTIDLRVHSICNDISLDGGALMTAPLLGADGEVYAVGHGKLGPCPAKNGRESCVIGGGSIF